MAHPATGSRVVTTECKIWHNSAMIASWSAAEPAQGGALVASAVQAVATGSTNTINPCATPPVREPPPPPSPLTFTPDKAFTVVDFPWATCPMVPMLMVACREMISGVSGDSTETSMCRFCFRRPSCPHHNTARRSSHTHQQPTLSARDMARVRSRLDPPGQQTKTRLRLENKNVAAASPHQQHNDAEKQTRCTPLPRVQLQQLTAPRIVSEPLGAPAPAAGAALEASIRCVRASPVGTKMRPGQCCRGSLLEATLLLPSRTPNHTMSAEDEKPTVEDVDGSDSDDVPGIASTI